MLYIEGTVPSPLGAATRLPPDTGRFQGVRWDIVFQAILDRLSDPADGRILRAAIKKMEVIPPSMALSETEMIAAWARFVELFPQHDREAALVYFRDLLRRTGRLKKGFRRQWYDVEKEWQKAEQGQPQSVQGFPARFGWSGTTYNRIAEGTQGTEQMGYVPTPPPPALPGGGRQGVPDAPWRPPSTPAPGPPPAPDMPEPQGPPPGAYWRPAPGHKYGPEGPGGKQKEVAQQQNREKLDSLKKTLQGIGLQALEQAQAELGLSRPGTLSPSRYVKLEKRGLALVKQIANGLPKDKRRSYYNCTLDWDNWTQTYEADCDYRIISPSEISRMTTPYFQTAIQQKGMKKGKPGITGNTSRLSNVRMWVQQGVSAAAGTLGLPKATSFSIRSGMTRVSVRGPEIQQNQFDALINEAIREGKRLYGRQPEYDPSGYLIGPADTTKITERTWRDRAVNSAAALGYTAARKGQKFMPSPAPECRKLSVNKASNGKKYAICSLWKTPYKANKCKHWYLSGEKDRYGYEIIKCDDWERVPGATPQPPEQPRPPARKPEPRPPAIHDKIPYAMTRTPEIVRLEPGDTGTLRRPRCTSWKTTYEIFGGKKFKVKTCVKLNTTNQCVQTTWLWDARAGYFKDYCSIVYAPGKTPKPVIPAKPPTPVKPPALPDIPKPELPAQPHETYISPERPKIPPGYISGKPTGCKKYAIKPIYKVVFGSRKKIYVCKELRGAWTRKQCLQTALWYDPKIKAWKEDCILAAKPAPKPPKPHAPPSVPTPPTPHKPAKPPPPGAFKPRCISSGWETSWSKETGTIKALACFAFADGVKLNDCIEWAYEEDPAGYIRKTCLWAIRTPTTPPKPTKPPTPTRPQPKPTPQIPGAPKPPKAPRCKAFVTDVLKDGIAYRRCTSLAPPYRIYNCTRWSTVYDPLRKTQTQTCIEAEIGARGGSRPPLPTCLKWQVMGAERSTGLPIFKCVTYQGKAIRDCVLWSKRPREDAQGKLIAHERYCTIWKPKL